MTRLWGLGMALEQVIARTTYHPAQLIREENEIGTLAVGSRADITILVCEQGPWTLSDGQAETLTVDQRLIPAWVIRACELIEPNQRLLRDVCHPLSTAGNGSRLRAPSPITSWLKITTQGGHSPIYYINQDEIYAVAGTGTRTRPGDAR